MADIEKTVAPAAQEEIIGESTSSSNTEKGVFFPWLEDKERKHLSIRVLRIFPLWGAFGLVVNDEHLKYLPKPAVWLSVILSMNAILVHIAVTQGIAISWWYRASRKQATIEDLHNIWAVGSNRFYAVTSTKAFNYVALAAIFVAILPIDGILLQNAVSSTLTYRSSTPLSTPFWVADSFPHGFSAALNPDGTVSTLTPIFQGLIPSVIGSGQGVYSYVSIPGGEGHEYVELNGTFNVVGFTQTCNNYTIPYDLPLNNHTSTETVPDSTMFSVDILWNFANPNTISVNTLHKPDSACVGQFTVTNCSLDMASVKEPLVASNQSAYYWYWTMQNQPPSSLPSGSVNYLFPRVDNTTATVFGGLAKALNSYYESSAILHANTTGTSFSINGIYC
ncbi:hypothetical protein BDZ45DRAFT_751793 [Acephala macrosclerotiorum]|nr:hypothetical protein BDZ45DRAFT_751793 [Acephala macrosclerotiorum]